MRMTTCIIVSYLLIALGFGIWQVSMDRKYGVVPGASQHWLLLVVISLDWPIGIPFAMAAVACGGWGRWPLEPRY